MSIKEEAIVETQGFYLVYQLYCNAPPGPIRIIRVAFDELSRQPSLPSSHRLSCGDVVNRYNTAALSVLPRLWVLQLNSVSVDEGTKLEKVYAEIFYRKENVAIKFPVLSF